MVWRWHCRDSFMFTEHSRLLKAHTDLMTDYLCRVCYVTVMALFLVFLFNLLLCCCFASSFHGNYSHCFAGIWDFKADPSAAGLVFPVCFTSSSSDRCLATESETAIGSGEVRLQKYYIICNNININKHKMKNNGMKCNLI